MDIQIVSASMKLFESHRFHQELIIRGSSGDEIEAQAKKEGMMTILEDVIFPPGFRNSQRKHEWFLDYRILRI